MIRFILSKLLYLVPTFIGITIIAFSFVRILPGDPVLLMAGERGVTPERHAELSAQLGYDQPIVLQYFDFLGRLLQGDMGNSLVTKKPVLDEFLTLFPATVELGLCAIIIATVIGVTVGVFAAIRRGSWFDQISMTLALVGFSMPIFWWGLLLIIFFSGILGWTPVSGRISLLYYFPNVTGFMLIDSLLSGQKGAFTSALSHLILPSLVLATIPLAVIARQTRSAMLDYRPANRRADGGCNPDGNYLFVARYRQMDDRFHFPARLSGRAVWPFAHRGAGDDRQPVG